MVYSQETSLSQFSDPFFNGPLNRDDSLYSTQPGVPLTFWQAALNDVKSSHQRLTHSLILPQGLREIWTANVLISQENRVINTDIQSPSDGTHWQPPFINHHRNDQPFSVIPAYYSQLFQGTAFPKATGDNDNVSNMRKPCNRIWLHAAQHCQAVRLRRRMESNAKSLRQRPERLLFHELCVSDWRLCLFLFIAVLLEWHIFNHYDQSAGAQV